MLGAHEEQLLDGVAMTTSISCSAQEEYQISEDSGDAELQLSLNEEEDDSMMHPSIARPSRALLTETIKTKSRSRCDRRLLTPSFTPPKTSTKKTWQTLFSLQDRLFEVHFIGLLESTHSMMQKLNQLIVTEEYGRLKAYQRELLAVIKEVQFGLAEYQKQKKGMLAQIELLRMDNDHLYCTINELHTIIEDLEKEMANYFDNNPLTKYLSNEARSVSVPLARTFTHSIQEMTLLKLKEEEQHDKFITVEQFSAFLLDLKKESENMLNGFNQHSCLLSNSLSQSFRDDSSIWNWLNDIVNNFSALASAAPQSKPSYSNHSSAERVKVVETFLNRLSRSRDHFLSTLESSSHKSLYLWHVIHSSLVTFLGILITETHQCPLEISFGDNTKTWMRIFIDEIKILLEQSHIVLEKEERHYFDGIERLVGEVHELVMFRMLRV